MADEGPPFRWTFALSRSLGFHAQFSTDATKSPISGRRTGRCMPWPCSTQFICCCLLGWLFGRREALTQVCTNDKTACCFEPVSISSLSGKRKQEDKWGLCFHYIMAIALSGRHALVLLRKCYRWEISFVSSSNLIFVDNGVAPEPNPRSLCGRGEAYAVIDRVCHLHSNGGCKG